MLLRRRRRCLLYAFGTIAFCYILATLHISMKEASLDTLEADHLSMVQRIEYARHNISVQKQLQETLLNHLHDVYKKVKAGLTGDEPVVLPVLVMACNRPANLERTLLQLFRYNAEPYRPAHVKIPVIVSQDCAHVPTADIVRKYADKVTFLQQPDQDTIPLSDKDKRWLGYYLISRHYKWALGQVFDTLNYNAVIIVEDDLDLSSDFFEYFVATLPILHSDPTLWCVSAWNDNGKSELISGDAALLYRSDFFPGLGWMLEKKTWEDIRDRWPTTFWDDWMRKPENRKERACIRPEIPRTSTFGKEGTSKGQYFEKHLQFIKHNEKFVPFTQLDLKYLHKNTYDAKFTATVYNATVGTLDSVLNWKHGDTPAVRIEYTDKEQFKVIARNLGIMDDFKAGVPRAAYLGIVSLAIGGHRVYVAPPTSWQGYDVSWT